MLKEIFKKKKRRNVSLLRKVFFFSSAVYFILFSRSKISPRVVQQLSTRENSPNERKMALYVTLIIRTLVDNVRAR